MIGQLITWIVDKFRGLRRWLEFELIMGDIETDINNRLVQRYGSQLLLKHVKEQIIIEAIDICKYNLRYSFDEAIMDPNEWYVDGRWSGYYIDIYDNGLYHRVYINLLNPYY